MAKGLTSSYLPLGAVAMRHEIAEAFETKMFYGGLTYSSHPVSLAAALATIRVYEEDDLIGNARAARAGHARRTTSALAAKHPSVGAHPQPRPVRDPRPRPEPRPVDAADPVQRHVRRDEGDRQVLPRRTACTRSRRTTRSTPTRRCASPRSSSPRASRSSIAPSTSPTRRSRASCRDGGHDDRGGRDRDRSRTRAAAPGRRRVALAWVVIVAGRRRRLGGRQVAGRRSLAHPRVVARASPIDYRARAAVPATGSRRTRRCRTSGTSSRAFIAAGPAQRAAARPDPRRAGAVHVPRGAGRLRRRRRRSGCCSGSCSSIRGWPSGRSCRTSSPRRPCRSSPSRRSSSSRRRPAGCRSRSSRRT